MAIGFQTTLSPFAHSLKVLEAVAMTPSEREWMLRHLTHSHLWSHTLSRRQLLGRALGATATGALLATMGSELLNAQIVQADESDQVVQPTPIPGGDFGTHHFLPGRGKEVSTINDFNGMVAIGQLRGAGTGTDTVTGASTRLSFSVDNRFLVGGYIGVDGRLHRAAFGVF
jgi:hypothetical protein